MLGHVHVQPLLLLLLLPPGQDGGQVQSQASVCGGSAGLQRGHGVSRSHQDKVGGADLLLDCRQDPEFY